MPATLIEPEVDEDYELVLAKREKLRLLSVKETAIREDGLGFYRPMPKQDAFHRAAGQFRRRLYEGGNRSGKTTLGAAEDCSWLRGHRPFYPVGDPARTAGIPTHPIKLAIVTPDWEKTREVWTEESPDNPGKLWKYLRRRDVAGMEHHQTGALKAVSMKSGSWVKFIPVKAWKQDPMIAESSDYDAIHVDEPCPEQMFKGLARGLIDRRGAAWFTLTALSEPWIQDWFFPEDSNCVRDGAWSERVTIFENQYLGLASIKDFEDTLTDEEKECRLYGIPLRLAGLVYKEFSQDKHVLKSEPHGWSSWLPPKDWAHYFHIDPHPQTPMAALFCAISPLGQHFYYDEIFDRCTVEDLARRIRTKLSGRNVIRGRIDPIAVVRDPITDTSILQELARCGVFVTQATKDREFGILNAKESLKKDAFVYISPNCRRYLWEIRRWAWDEQNNKPVDKDDHMMENFYRMELDNMVFMERGSASLPSNVLEIPFADMSLPDLDYNLA